MRLWVSMCLYSNIGTWKLTVIYIILAQLHFQLILKTRFFGYRRMCQKARLYGMRVHLSQHFVALQSNNIANCYWKRVEISTLVFKWFVLEIYGIDVWKSDSLAKVLTRSFFLFSIAVFSVSNVTVYILYSTGNNHSVWSSLPVVSRWL